MRVLITGITGFVGGHLAERLLAAGGCAVAGIARHATWPASLAHLSGNVELIAADIHDGLAVADVLKRLRPDAICHLAGYASTGKSFVDPAGCWYANLDGTRALYDAVALSGVRPRILFASTGLVYGDPEPGTDSLDEHAPLKPASPYAASKAAADLLSYQLARHPGLDIVRVRLFNQIGPRQSADFAVANFARQIAAAEAGRQGPELTTGDLSAWRDFTDVRDMAEALRLLLAHGETGEAYNAGSGRVWRMRDVLQSLVGLARVPVTVREQADPARPADTAVSKANPAKLKACTGWVPKYELHQTLADTLDYWRNVG